MKILVVIVTLVMVIVGLIFPVIVRRVISRLSSKRSHPLCSFTLSHMLLSFPLSPDHLPWFCV
jgi:hypothetical protein